MKMKFWKNKKTSFDVSETDQIYKVIYLGNVVTSWAKGEHTLEKPLTALWRNYCNNYANYHVKSGDVKKRQSQSKQILMKLTICNQGLKAITREFGLTEYWANRITFCGQNSNFPRVFAWIYRHEAKQKKQELRVHACFVNSQSNVNKMISTLQQKVNFALNEFKREKRLRENARRILSMNESLNLNDDEITPEDKTDSEFFNEFVGRLYDKMNGQLNDNKLKEDDLSINSSERTNFESANTSKNSTLDSKRITRNLSQNSLNSIKSKSSTSSRKSTNYDCNLMPARRQFLVKGLKNFKEPIERSRSAPKLSSISEEFLSSDDEEEDSTYDQSNYFGKLLNNNNFVNYYNICEEEEPDDEEIIRELGLISGLTAQEINEEIIDEHDKTLTQLDENDLDGHFNYTELNKLKTKLFVKKNDDCIENKSNMNNSETTNSETSSEDLKATVYNNAKCHSILNGRMNSNASTLCNGNQSILSSDCESAEKQTNEMSTTDHDHNNQLIETQEDKQSDQNRSSDSQTVNQMSNNESIKNESSDNTQNDKTLTHTNQSNEPKDSYLYNNGTLISPSPQFIIFKRTNSFNNRECDLHAKQIEKNCKLIQDLVLNF